jgi:hypothetical protein
MVQGRKTIVPRFRVELTNIPVKPDKLGQLTQSPVQLFTNSKYGAMEWAKNELHKYAPELGVTAVLYERFEILVEGIEIERTGGAYKK